MKLASPSYQYLQLEDAPYPNLVLVSRQIDGMRSVLRRLRTASDPSAEVRVDEKPEQTPRHIA